MVVTFNITYRLCHHRQKKSFTELPTFTELSIFLLSREECNTKATEYVTFGLPFRILVSFPFLCRFERHCL